MLVYIGNPEIGPQNVGAARPKPFVAGIPAFNEESSNPHVVVTAQQQVFIFILDDMGFKGSKSYLVKRARRLHSISVRDSFISVQDFGHISVCCLQG